MFLFVTEIITIDQFKKDFRLLHTGFSTIEETLGENVAQRRYKLAFFSEGRATIDAINDTTNDLIVQAFDTLVIAVTSMSIVFLIVGLIRIKTISRKMMKQVVFLLESCETILLSRKGSKSAGLTFKPSTAELNELHLTFNKVAKTISIASTKVEEGEEAQAMLNFNEAYHIFKDFKNERQMSVCVSNIGALRMKVKEHSWAAVAYTQAAESMEVELGIRVLTEDSEENQPFIPEPKQTMSRKTQYATNDDYHEAYFIYACRLFFKSLANIAIVQEEIPTRSLEDKRYFKTLQLLSEMQNLEALDKSL